MKDEKKNIWVECHIWRIFQMWVLWTATTTSTIPAAATIDPDIIFVEEWEIDRERIGEQ